jgi:hypothetical protein
MLFIDVLYKNNAIRFRGFLDYLKMKTQVYLKFLDEETSLCEDY